MLAFPRPLSPCHGSQDVLHSSYNCNFALGVNNRGPSPFRCSRFGTQQRMLLSPVRPMQGGVQNSASSACWAKKKKTNEAKGDEKAKGFGKSTSKAQGPSVGPESKADDGELRFVSALEELILGEQFSGWIDATIYDHMPPACDLAWKESQQAWLDLAINHPITLNKSGCSVHLFGIAHGLPTNASALKALVDAVQPDTITIEQAPQSSKRLRAVAQQLAPQLDKLMALGFPAGIREAYTALSPQDRCVWRQVVFEGDLALKSGSRPQFRVDKCQLMVHGTVPSIEWLAAARFAPSGNNGISLEGIDIEARGKARGVLEDLKSGEEYHLQMKQLMGGPEALSAHLYRGADLAFAEWRNNADKMGALMDGLLSMPPNYKDFLDSLGRLSTTPAEIEESDRVRGEVGSRMTGKAAAYAGALRDTRNLEMLDRLQQLAEGRWSAGGPLRPRKCIVAVVGQAHVAPMRELAVARNNM